MELNKEQIIKALECCHTASAEDCEDCPYSAKGGIEDNFYTGCCNILCKDALALIRELTEENYRLIEEVIYWRDEAKSKAKGETT